MESGTAVLRQVHHELKGCSAADFCVSRTLAAAGGDTKLQKRRIPLSYFFFVFEVKTGTM